VVVLPSLPTYVRTDERNSFKVDTVNALVSIKENSEFNCSQAFNMFISKPELLQKAKI
jgi:hypothetical protein